MSSNVTDEGDQKTQTAAYIASLTGELALMARQSGLSTLGYLLDMAKLEAEQTARLDSGQAQ